MSHLQRGRILLSQSRFNEAEKEFRLEISADPNRALPHALLAMVLSKQNKYREAIETAQHAVHLSPDWAFTHYVLASVLDDKDRLNDALLSILEALRLDPQDADYYALLASIQFQQRHWDDALKSAETGLAIDAENVDCLNLRALALNKLGKQNEAGTAIDSALAKDPENALSHSNQGWTWLQRNDSEKAMEHFREALRINPQLDWAREGIVEALKAKNPLYRILLRYFFWTSRLSRRAQWALILGLFLGSRILRGVARSNPELDPWIQPVLILYAAFVLLTWCSDPLFSLVLRLHPFGRLALSREQTMASNLVGICLLAAVSCLALLGITHQTIFAGAAVATALLMLPISATYQCRPGKRRKFLAGYTIVLAILIIIACATIFVAQDAAIIFLILVFLGIFLFQWIALIILRN